MANSNVIREACIKIRAGRVLVLFKFPNSVIRRWPAIMLAESRTARAIGRIMFLIVSIIIIKGIRIEGVPEGRRWANM